MAKVVATQAHERTADQLFQTTGADAARYFRTISVDDSASAFTAGTTDLGSPANEYDADATAAEVSNGRKRLTIVIPAGSGNFNIKRVAVHDDTAANVSGSSSTFAYGFSGHSVTKDANTELTVSLDLIFA